MSYGTLSVYLDIHVVIDLCLVMKICMTHQSAEPRHVYLSPTCLIYSSVQRQGPNILYIQSCLSYNSAIDEDDEDIQFESSGFITAMQEMFGKYLTQGWIDLKYNTRKQAGTA